MVRQATPHSCGGPEERQPLIANSVSASSKVEHASFFSSFSWRGVAAGALAALALTAAVAGSLQQSSSALGQSATTNGIDNACLDACRNDSPSLTAALGATPMDCDGVRNSPLTEIECYFTSAACHLVDGDLELNQKIDENCPTALDPPPAELGLKDPGAVAAAKTNAKDEGALGVSEQDEAGSKTQQAGERSSSSSSSELFTSDGRTWKLFKPDEWKQMTKDKDKKVRLLNPAPAAMLRKGRRGKLGHLYYSVAPRPEGPQPAATFTLGTGCLTQAVKDKYPGFFATGIESAYIVHHDFGSPDFFSFDNAIKMEAGALDFIPCMSTKLGVVCPKSDGEFEITTDRVDFEWGFALKDRDGYVLYEIGSSEAPLYQAGCDNMQMYGQYWNRVMTLKPPGDNPSYVFGSCDVQCEPPPFSCPEGTWYLGGTCVVRCPPGKGGTGDSAETRKCAPCPTNCNSCTDGVCTECANSKYLQDGTCHDTCPAGTSSGGSRRRLNLSPSDFKEFGVSFDAADRYTQPVFENNYPMIYFGHGYGARGTAYAEDLFLPEIGDVDSWTEAWISATADDRCGSDQYSTGKYCTMSKPSGDGNANCCTWHGKMVMTSIITMNNNTVDDPDDTHRAWSGFNTQRSLGNYGNYINGAHLSIAESGNKGRYSFRDETWTTRVLRDGSIATWIGHSLKNDGIPTSAPTYDKPQHYGPLGDFHAFQVEKTGGWAEGGAVMSEISGMVKTSREWTIGRVCE